jgi:hypothetical protein
MTVFGLLIDRLAVESGASARPRAAGAPVLTQWHIFTKGNTMRRLLSPLSTLLALLALTTILRPGAWGQTCVPVDTLKTTVTLGWTPPVLSAGMTLLSYGLDQHTDGGAWVSLAPPPIAATTALVSGLLAGHRNAWRLAATATLRGGSTGTSGFASQGLPPPGARVLLAPAPTSLTATPQ